MEGVPYKRQFIKNPRPARQHPPSIQPHSIESFPAQSRHIRQEPAGLQVRPDDKQQEGQAVTPSRPELWHDGHVNFASQLSTPASGNTLDSLDSHRYWHESDGAPSYISWNPETPGDPHDQTSEDDDEDMVPIGSWFDAPPTLHGTYSTDEAVTQIAPVTESNHLSIPITSPAGQTGSTEVITSDVPSTTARRGLDVNETWYLSPPKTNATRTRRYQQTSRHKHHPVLVDRLLSPSKPDTRPQLRESTFSHGSQGIPLDNTESGQLLSSSPVSRMNNAPQPSPGHPKSADAHTNSASPMQGPLVTSKSRSKDTAKSVPKPATISPRPLRRSQRLVPRQSCPSRRGDHMSSRRRRPQRKMDFYIPLQTVRAGTDASPQS